MWLVCWAAIGPSGPVFPVRPAPAGVISRRVGLRPQRRKGTYKNGSDNPPQCRSGRLRRVCFVRPERMRCRMMREPRVAIRTCSPAASRPPTSSAASGSSTVSTSSRRRVSGQQQYAGGPVGIAQPRVQPPQGVGQLLDGLLLPCDRFRQAGEQGAVAGGGFGGRFADRHTRYLFGRASDGGFRDRSGRGGTRRAETGPCACFVEQVDRLVRKVPVGEVAPGEFDAGPQCLVGVADPVVAFVAGSQLPENGQGSPLVRAAPAGGTGSGGPGRGLRPAYGGRLPGWLPRCRERDRAPAPVSADRPRPVPPGVRLPLRRSGAVRR